MASPAQDNDRDHIGRESSKFNWRNALSPTLYVFLLLISFSAFKLYILESESREFLGCHWCLSNKAVIFELRFLFIVATLHLFGEIAQKRWLRFTSRLLLILVVLITAIDLAVFKQFWMRFTLYKLEEYSFEWSAIESVLHFTFTGSANAWLEIAGSILTIGVLVRYLFTKRIGSSRPLALGVCCLSVLFLGAFEPKEFHFKHMQNSIEAFFASMSIQKPYSENFYKTIVGKQSTKQTCIGGRDERPNLILLLIESQSMYHSKLFSGLNDWMPEFDEVSKHGKRFTNFYANGVSTEQGLISLFTGEPPISKGVNNARTEFEQFSHTKETIPKLLNGFGYRTEFLTTGDLSFLNKKQWLQDIGFTHAEGHDAHYYDGMMRYTFNAPADEALYGRALKELQVLKAQSSLPYFLTLETVTTHMPFYDPVSGTRSQELAFRYADKQLGMFVKQLKAIGYFNNGYLMVMGDHRAMTPATQEEWALYGDRAYSRIPFAMVGSGLMGEVEKGTFSQNDLLPSLKHWLGKGNQCITADQGVYLPYAIKSPTCVITHRAYGMNTIYPQCANEDYVVELNGDNTHYVEGKTGPASLITEINGLRLNLGFR